MTLAATFLGGAAGRLLPAHVPLRFFGAAAAFHLAAWVVLLSSAGEWPHFRGGLGWPLAALHLLTLGVFGMAALGAGAQLLPVATRQAPMPPKWLQAIWWLYTPGTAVLALGMGIANLVLLAIGACAVAFALAAWAVVMARHLLRARGMPGVIAHAWGALVSLAAVLCSALLLVAAWLGAPVPGRAEMLPHHIVFAPFGFMGLLTLGLSYILVPMFALSPSPRERIVLGSFALAGIGLVAAAAAPWMPWPHAARTAAWFSGSLGVALHLHAMQRALREGMRKALGQSIMLVRIGWACLAAALMMVGAMWAGVEWPRDAAWLGLAIAAWLLSLVTGFMQRILPFLAALHAAQGRRRGPMASALTHAQALRVHFACHLAALALAAAALASGSAAVAFAAAAVGTTGAAAFGFFYLEVLRRLREASS